jgi:hypothetical protein
MLHEPAALRTSRSDGGEEKAGDENGTTHPEDAPQNVNQAEQQRDRLVIHDLASRGHRFNCTDHIAVDVANEALLVAVRV